MALLNVVAALHEAGWVHNDLKPDNIMLDKSGATLKLVGARTRAPPPPPLCVLKKKTGGVAGADRPRRVDADQHRAAPAR